MVILFHHEFGCNNGQTALITLESSNALNKTVVALSIWTAVQSSFSRNGFYHVRYTVQVRLERKIKPSKLVRWPPRFSQSLLPYCRYDHCLIIGKILPTEPEIRLKSKPSHKNQKSLTEIVLLVGLKRDFLGQMFFQDGMQWSKLSSKYGNVVVSSSRHRLHDVKIPSYGNVELCQRKKMLWWDGAKIRRKRVTLCGVKVVSDFRLKKLITTIKWRMIVPRSTAKSKCWPSIHP